MMNDLRRRKFDVVVVWALDRLARSLKQLLNLAEECRSVGVDLVGLFTTFNICTERKGIKVLMYTED